MAKGNTKGSMLGLVTMLVATVLVIVGFALGFTVNPDFWNTANVRTSGNTWFMVSGVIAIIAAAAYVALYKFFPNGIVLHLLTIVVGMCAISALSAMWSNCVVEIAYIYGEGNLELGNTAAVNGSIILFVASGMFVVGALVTVVANALGLTKAPKL